MNIRNAPATKTVAVLLAGIVGIVAAYFAAGVIGGAIPANRGWRAPRDGVTIWVETNGIHTGIVMPKQAAGIDWRQSFPARDLADPRMAAFDHVAVGWGERDFYLKTAVWSDLRPGTIAAAAFGSKATLLHVEHIPRPRPSGTVRRVVVTPDQYRRIAAQIHGEMVPGGARHRGYGAYDVFYQGRGHYDAIRTCNAWTGDVLRRAGLRIGRWTPFPGTVMQWF